MWLKCLKIKNVQSHKDTTFNFSPGVNVITGTSQSGKTAALFRSLRLLILNRPLGLFLKSDFSEEADPMVVSLETTCGNTVTLTKSKKDAKYVVTNRRKKPKSFRIFKRSVPDMVKKALGIDFDLSFQDQLFPYSVFDSSTNLGRRINSVVGTEKLEKWMKKTSGILFTKKRELKIFKKTLTEGLSQIKEYKGLRKLKSRVVHLQYLETELNTFDDRLRDLNSINSKYLEIKEGIYRLNGYSNLLNRIDRINKDRRKFDELTSQLNLFNEYKHAFFKIVTLKKEIDSLKIQYLKCISSKKRCPLCFSKIEKKRIETTIRNIIV